MGITAELLDSTVRDLAGKSKPKKPTTPEEVFLAVEPEDAEALRREFPRTTSPTSNCPGTRA